MRGCIDLNADLGEGCGDDAGLMPIITSCNIACGGHAGDAQTMCAALELASRHAVCIGAHPAFPDRLHFGRRPMSLRGLALQEVVMEQISALVRHAADRGLCVSHVKPHGALYNMAARDPDLAGDVALAVQEVLPQARLIGPPGSTLACAAGAYDLAFSAEGFADRAYEGDGRLRSRALPGAVLDTTDAQVAQACRLVLHDEVVTCSGAVLAYPIQTLCLHGDTPGAVAAATAIRRALEAEGVDVCRPD